ncbi:hypothetical protein AB4580_22270 [Vibrio splendidus]
MENQHELQHTISEQIININMQIANAYGTFPREINTPVTSMGKELSKLFESVETSNTYKDAYLFSIDCIELCYKIFNKIQPFSDRDLLSGINRQISNIDLNLNKLLNSLQILINRELYINDSEWPHVDKFNILESESLDKINLETNKSITNIQGMIDNLDENLNNSIINFQQEFHKNQSNIVNTVNKRYDKISIEIQEFSNQYKGNIINSLDDSANSQREALALESQESLDLMRKIKDETIQNVNSRIDKEIKEYSSLKEKLNLEFSKKLKSLEAQLSVVASSTMCDQHIRQANTERRVYWSFQIMGFLFMIAAIYAGSVFFSEITNIRLPFFPKPDLVIHIDDSFSNEQSPLTLMFMRLSMIILLTAPAFYLLKEAALHRHKENIYRQRGIQLATISPYLEELDKEERAAIKKELVSSFFNFHDGKADTQNVPDFLRDMKEAVGIAKSLNGQTKTVSQRFNRKAK